MRERFRAEVSTSFSSFSLKLVKACFSYCFVRFCFIDSGAWISFSM